MESGFLELVKAYEKAKPVVEKEENGVTPRFFVRVLVELEEVVELISLVKLVKLV